MINYKDESTSSAMIPSDQETNLKANQLRRQHELQRPICFVCAVSLQIGIQLKLRVYIHSLRMNREIIELNVAGRKREKV